MSKMTFNEAKEMHLATLQQYVPIVARVHGGAHPEFHEVREVFDVIANKVKEAASDSPELNEEFAKLREITNHYTAPNDVCESYEAVYRMLGELDKAYSV